MQDIAIEFDIVQRPLELALQPAGHHPETESRQYLTPRQRHRDTSLRQRHNKQIRTGNPGTGVFIRFVTDPPRKGGNHAARLIDPVQLLGQLRLRPTVPGLHVREECRCASGLPGHRGQRQLAHCPQLTQYRSELGIAWHRVHPLTVLHHHPR
jgi:hypothetical protein